MAEYAAHEFRNAEKLERRPAFDKVDAFRKAREAEHARADGERLLKPPKHLVGDASTEIVPAAEPGTKVPGARLHFLDTLVEPNTISVDASEYRAAVAARAGVLSPALDAAVSARAKNSIEKMLCHQMAAVHMAGFELLVRVQESPSLHQFPPVEIARMTNSGRHAYWACPPPAMPVEATTRSPVLSLLKHFLNVFAEARSSPAPVLATDHVRR